MDFGFTAEQKALRNEVQEFIRENVTPDVLTEVEKDVEASLLEIKDATDSEGKVQA